VRLRDRRDAQSIVGKTGFLRSTLLQTKLAHNSYAVGSRVAPHGAVLFWDTGDPTRSYRSHRDFDYVIVGGEDLQDRAGGAHR
jgi:hypothetical protein